MLWEMKGFLKQKKCIQKRKIVKQLPMERAWKATDNLEEQVNVEKRIN